ncbi:MAG: methyltransferase domain-containing protein [Gemmatimonadaceae bacterium]|nr:methyltransferase domain-containing protein [Gemmatimonadaceae bacterium]
MLPSAFDASYYRRYYTNPATAVVTKVEARAEVRFVLAFCSYYGLEIRRFADVGAGTGWWAREFSRQRPRCRDVETYDASPYAARLYGHREVSIEKLGGRPADLVVCRDVLRYVGDADAREGITRLARKCRGVLYLHVLTRDDEVDEPASDMSGRLRSKRWYLKELTAAGFRNAGSGLFVSRKFKDFYCFAIEEL